MIFFPASSSAEARSRPWQLPVAALWLDRWQPERPDPPVSGEAREGSS